MQLARFNRRTIFGLAALPWMSARPALATSSPNAASQIWNRTELYFGSMKPDGSMVSDAEFMRFVDREITPRFPDGLTLLKGYGQFKNSAEMIVREDSRLLILFYPPQMRDANKSIQEIRGLFKSAFQQESVLRVDSFSVVSF